MESWTTARARVARLSQNRTHDPARLAHARRRLAVARAHHVTRAALAPLSPAERADVLAEVAAEVDR